MVLLSLVINRHFYFTDLLLQNILLLYQVIVLTSKVLLVHCVWVSFVHIHLLRRVKMDNLRLVCLLEVFVLREP